MGFRWALALAAAQCTSLRLCSQELEERANLISDLLSKYSGPYVYQAGRELVNLACRRNSSQIPDAWHMTRYDLPHQVSRKLWPGPRSPPKHCALCSRRGGDGPVLYMTERTDGLGSRAAQLLHALALTSFLEIDFGGIVPSWNEEPHGVNAAKALSKLLGHDFSELRIGTDSEFDVCFYSFPDFLSETLQHRCMRWPEHASMMVASYDFLRALPVENWEPAFLKRLRHQTPLRRQALQHFAGPSLKVVLHIRRGDVVGHGNPRNFPDEVYFHLAEQIREDVPEAEIHVFSTTKEAAAHVDFSGYHARGMIVHLDGDEADDWAHMAQAEILVLAPSSFSWVAGVLNDKCVLAFRGTEALPEWIVHTGTLHREDHLRLRRCLDRLRES
ncbi:unnamed protein product, partial [Symbiodinium natans]